MNRKNTLERMNKLQIQMKKKKDIDKQKEKLKKMEEKYYEYVESIKPKIWKISLIFQSDIHDVYTYEEETADDYYIMLKKKRRMITRWLKIIDNSIKDEDIESLTEDDMVILINEKLSELNESNPGERPRKFIFREED